MRCSLRTVPGVTVPVVPVPVLPALLPDTLPDILPAVLPARLPDILAARLPARLARTTTDYIKGHGSGHCFYNGYLF